MARPDMRATSWYGCCFSGKIMEIKWYGSNYIGYHGLRFSLRQHVPAGGRKLMDDMKGLNWPVWWTWCSQPRPGLRILVVEEILSKVKVIDLSADFRIKDVRRVRAVSKAEHASPGSSARRSTGCRR